MSTKFDGWMVVSLCCLLTACSGEQAVEQAAQQRWNSLLKGDYQAAYQFYDTAYKQNVSFEHFRNRMQRGGLWNKADVKQVSCDAAGKQCEAEVEVTIKMKMRGMPSPVETNDVIKETWRKEGLFSDWRYLKNNKLN